MNTKRLLVGIGAAAAALILVVGCSNNESTNNATTTGAEATTSAGAAGTNEPSGAHNDADVAYVRMMIPHHEQAIEMAELVPSRSNSPEINSLATQIEHAQEPEIEQMEDWLTAWGVPEPEHQPMTNMPMTTMPGMPEMENGMHGMMTPEQMRSLESANGMEFDRMWLEMMIVHHEGAVTSSEEILRNGESEQVKELAQNIIASQQAEIAQMRQLLNR
ncbi:DUF305 domain-containing protein [Rhodococcus spongiicola]|uniref:DUF305 domain-containing protein n=1 Tax=Rhodococcus spongiicola TaxID=2487352 RepID=A0A438B534_9NOCA|nr:DUF305 domain-containing protein [Rhodococcus spongiicola]RVW06082.1 DUF305 domain-containing protein [Rhodococcus spongiicola]